MFSTVSVLCVGFKIECVRDRSLSGTISFSKTNEPRRTFFHPNVSECVVFYASRRSFEVVCGEAGFARCFFAVLLQQVGDRRRMHESLTSILSSAGNTANFGAQTSYGKACTVLHVGQMKFKVISCTWNRGALHGRSFSVACSLPKPFISSCTKREVPRLPPSWGL